MRSLRSASSRRKWDCAGCSALGSEVCGWSRGAGRIDGVRGGRAVESWFFPAPGDEPYPFVHVRDEPASDADLKAIAIGASGARVTVSLSAARLPLAGRLRALVSQLMQLRPILEDPARAIYLEQPGQRPQLIAYPATEPDPGTSGPPRQPQAHQPPRTQRSLYKGRRRIIAAPLTNAPPYGGWDLARLVHCRRHQRGQPLFSGIAAIADQAAAHRLGLLNPDLYALGDGPRSGIVDITRGNNTVTFTNSNGRTYTVQGYNAVHGGSAPPTAYVWLASSPASLGDPAAPADACVEPWAGVTRGFRS